MEINIRVHLTSLPTELTRVIERYLGDSSSSIPEKEPEPEPPPPPKKTRKRRTKKVLPTAYGVFWKAPLVSQPISMRIFRELLLSSYRFLSEYRHHESSREFTDALHKEFAIESIEELDAETNIAAKPGELERAFHWVCDYVESV